MRSTEVPDGLRHLWAPSYMKTVQIWCDAKRRDAHRDPALRSYLESMFDRGF